MLTEQALKQIMPDAPAARVKPCLAAIQAVFKEASINTVTRAAAFLAQIAHESGELKYMEEIASGAAYEGRADLGNTKVGDGKRYKGRGPIQITGRANYRMAGKALGIDLESTPTLAAEIATGFRVAGWYWTSRGLNARADALDFDGITRAINGGQNGRVQRLAYYQKALEVLGATALI